MTAADFLGVTVLVTLKDPPTSEIRGLVTDVIEQQLTLSGVTWLASGYRMNTLIVEGANIQELEIIPEGNDASPDVEPDEPVEQPLTDPAILSYDRPTALKTLTPHTSTKAQANQQKTPVSPVVLSEVDTNAFLGGPSRTVTKPPLPIVSKAKEGLTWVGPIPKRDDSMASATLNGPFNELAIDGGLRAREMVDYMEGRGNLEGEDEVTLDQALPSVQIPGDRAGKRTRRGGRRGRATRDAAAKDTPTQTMDLRDLDVALNPTKKKDPTGNVRKRNKGNASNGWRQTLMMEDAVHLNHRSLEPMDNAYQRAEAASLKAQGQRQRDHGTADLNGWATEDATGIQDMGDFDFAGNLSKFDKRGVFDRIRQDDTTADEDRLVSINRLPARPGTSGGKNLHHTENVLDSPRAKARVDWNSEAGDSEDDMNEAKISSDRSSRRNISRSSVRRPPSRKSSLMAAGDEPRAPVLGDPVRRTRQLTLEQVGTPKLKSNGLASSSRLPKPLNDASKSSLQLVTSDHLCPCLSPLQMLELEQLAVSELGLTEDIMTENASRCIAETASQIITAVTDTNDIRLNKGNRVASSLIVTLAGNNKTGARAIAGARQLRNHGFRVVLCVLGLEREDDLLDSVRRQLTIFRRSGGQVTKIDILARTLKALHAPVGLIVDALLGMHMSFDDLRTDDQAAYFALAGWTNKSGIDILAIDVPSGLDASSGVATATDETNLTMKADYLLSLGAPKIGLLAALDRSNTYRRSKLYVADIGISNTAWKKFGTRRRYGVEFGRDWVACLRYEPGVS